METRRREGISSRRCYSTVTLTSATALGLVGALTLAPAAAQTATPMMTTSWFAAMAPQTLDPTQGLTFSNQTVRSTIIPSVGGSQAQLHISNLFGTEALVIGGVHLAQAADTGTPNSVAGTDVTVTFGGSQTTTIQPGQEATSDLVNFKVLERTPIDISVFYTNRAAVTNVSTHLITDSDHFFGPGNQLATVNFSATGNTGQEIEFVTELDVPAAGTGGSFSVFGASIVEGHQDGNNTHRGWVDDLVLELHKRGLILGAANGGLAGSQALSDNGEFGQAGETRFSRDSLTLPGIKSVILGDLIINDLPNGITLQQAIDATQFFVSAAHAAGLPIMCATQTPFQGSDGWTPAIEMVRTQYNTYLLGNPSPCDAITDQDAVLADPMNKAAIAPNLDSGDHDHPNALGYYLLSQAIPLSFFNNGAAVPAAQPLVANGVYTIKSVNSGLLIDDTGISPSPGTVQEQWNDNGGTNQEFTVTNLGDTVVTLTNKSNGLVLDVAPAAVVTDGDAIIQATPSGSMSQQWRIDCFPDGTCRIVNQLTQDVIDVSGGSTDAGATLDIFPFNWNPWQKWTFAPVSPAQGPATGPAHGHSRR
jgi:hypothetical protein